MQVLRGTLGCKLPIEIIYNGKYEMDWRTHVKFEVGPTVSTVHHEHKSKSVAGMLVACTAHTAQACQAALAGAHGPGCAA